MKIKKPMKSRIKTLISILILFSSAIEKIDDKRKIS